jgi:predicted metal-dependent hydrolase
MRSHLELEVVLPYRVSVDDVPSILDRHEQWIMDRHRILASRDEASGQSLMPSSVSLDFLGQTWDLQLLAGDRARLENAGSVLRLTCPSGRQDLGLTLLQRFLIQVGRDHLAPLCRRLSLQSAIPISNVQIRNQSTRWGSCSARGVISLNAKLLFLSPVLARHVMLHELCHVAHRNHGPSFWRQLEELDPQTREHDALLRRAWDRLPAWSKIRP